MILLLDNYDSFTYNLFHYLDAGGNHEITVIRNDVIELQEVENYDKIVLSPGPGLPSEAGKMMQLIEAYHQSKGFLGVCLGQQAIFEFFGGKLKNLGKVVHGQSKLLTVTDKRDCLFTDLPTQFKVGRYHSWVIENRHIPKGLVLSSVDEEGEAMSFYHTRFNIHCVQFHPESILSEHGHKIIENWLGN